MPSLCKYQQHQITFVQGLWASRLHKQFQGNLKMETTKGVTFESFMIVQCKLKSLAEISVEEYFCQSQEKLDSMIFNIFDLSGNGLISDQELSQMLLTLPEEAIITDILDMQTRTQSSPLLSKGKKKLLSQGSRSNSLIASGRRVSALDQFTNQYRVQKAPLGIKNLRLNRKLLVKTTRDVIGEMDPDEFNLGILEFKTLLTEEAFEISKKMI